MEVIMRVIEGVKADPMGPGIPRHPEHAQLKEVPPLVARPQYPGQAPNKEPEDREKLTETLCGGDPGHEKGQSGEKAFTPVTEAAREVTRRLGK